MIKRTSPVLAALLVASSLVLAVGDQRAQAAAPTLVWQREIGGTPVRGSSPLAVDLDGGGLDIVFGSMNGQVLALHGSDGSNVGGWPQQTTHAIHSSASAA